MKELVSLVQTQLHNQFLSGGLVLMVTGALMALCRRIPQELWGWVKRRFTVEVEVTNDDGLFDFVSVWLHAQPYTRRSRRLSARTMGQAGADVPVSQAEEDSMTRPRVIFSPAPGDHVFLYKRRIIWLNRNKEGNQPTAGTNGATNLGMLSSRKHETYSITVLGRKQQVIRDLIDEAIDSAIEIQRDRIATYVQSYNYWERMGLSEPRPLESVVLPDGVCETLKADIERFLASREWYRQLGIPWHRGYLFHGIAGSGKTSLIAALAGALKMNLYLLNIAGGGMDDEKLTDLARHTRPRSILVLEDVDAAIAAVASREQKDKGLRASEVTLSGLLNCLDGLVTKDGSIVVMTTNYRDRLDAALVRPGRVDIEVEFKAATCEQLRRLYLRFVPDANGDAEEFASEYVGRSMAEAQQVLLDKCGIGGTVNASSGVDALLEN